MRNRKIALGKKEKVTGICIFLLVGIVLWSLCGIKANAAEKAENDRMEYQIQEKHFVKEVRTQLEKQGYSNSGVTVTKVMDTDGSREYKVLVHHKDIDLQDAKEVLEVYAALDEITMEGERVTINYQLF